MTSCPVNNVSPVAGLKTGRSLETPNTKEFHILTGGLFVAYAGSVSASRNPMRTAPDTELQRSNGCKCPRCDDRIPDQFYCRECGYFPDWRRIEVYEAHREAA
jgi:hypothetical protein